MIDQPSSGEGRFSANTRTHRYRIFDRMLESSIEIPELQRSQAADHEPDFEFVLGRRRLQQRAAQACRHEWRDEHGQSSISCHETDLGTALRFYESVEFLLDHRLAKIQARHDGDLPATMVRHLLIDQVIPRALAAQGHVVLHASAVRVADGCIGFLGATGAGKSTLAASFLSAGLDLIADDALLLVPRAGGIAAIPSYSGCRLWPTSADHLRAYLQPADSSDSRAPKQRFATRGVTTTGEHYRLLGLFTLSEPSAEGDCQVPEVRKSGGAEALADLIRHALVMNPRNRLHQLGQLSALARVVNSQIEFFALSYPRRFATLPQVQAAALKAIGIGG